MGEKSRKQWAYSLYMNNASIKQKALDTLLARRKAMQEAYTRALEEPASYSINGSVSATNRSLEDIRQELAFIEREIAALCGVRQSGLRRQLPNYGGGC